MQYAIDWYSGCPALSSDLSYAQRSETQTPNKGLPGVEYQGLLIYLACDQLVKGPQGQTMITFRRDQKTQSVPAVSIAWLFIEQLITAIPQLAFN
jgi:hypothetical protein